MVHNTIHYYISSLNIIFNASNYTHNKKEKKRIESATTFPKNEMNYTRKQIVQSFFNRTK